MTKPDPDVLSYLSDLIDMNDSGEEVEIGGYSETVRDRAYAWIDSHTTTPA